MALALLLAVMLATVVAAAVFSWGFLSDCGGGDGESAVSILRAHLLKDQSGSSGDFIIYPADDVNNTKSRERLLRCA